MKVFYYGNTLIAFRIKFKDGNTHTERNQPPHIIWNHYFFLNKFINF